MRATLKDGLFRVAFIALCAPIAMILASLGLGAQAPTAAAQFTFTKDVAPILQQHCQECHRPTR
jgi:hypothetical protein